MHHRIPTRRIIANMLAASRNAAALIRQTRKK